MFNGTKYHELYYVFKIDLDDNSIITKQNNFINKDSKDSSYTWIEIDRLEEVEILPVELKEIIKEKEFKTIVVNEIKK